MFLRTYVYVSFGFGILFIVMLLAAVAFLSMAVFRWQQSSRNRRLKVSCILFAFAVVALAVPQTLSMFVDIIPRELTAENYETLRKEMRDRVAQSSHVDTGEFAPDFAIELEDGTSFELSEHRGSVVLINFFRTDCGPCNQELPVLQEIWDKYGEREDFRMVAINRGETSEAVAIFKNTRNLTLPFAVDEDRSIYNQYALENIPRTYLVARDGTIRFQSVGFMQDDMYDGDSEEIRREVANALASGR